MSAFYDRQIANASDADEDWGCWRLPRFVLVRQCPCGIRYDEHGWKSLEVVGMQDDGEGGEFELRNCFGCGSTISRADGAS